MAAVGLAVLYALLRVIRSPFGHVLVAIRENQTRATFQGYPVQRYKLAVFVLSSAVTALAGGLTGFQHHIVTAETTSVELSGDVRLLLLDEPFEGLAPAIVEELRAPSRWRSTRPIAASRPSSSAPP